MSPTTTDPNNALLSWQNANGESSSLNLAMRSGTIGPDVVNIAALPKNNLFTFDPGFAATAACESSITYIDGNQGVLLHRGYPIEQLAEQSQFLEVAYLLLYGELPNSTQWQEFVVKITQAMQVPETLKDCLAGFPTTAHPMAIMCSLTSALAGYFHNRLDIHDAACRKQIAIELIAKIPIIAAMAYRHTQQLPIIAPNAQLTYTENFLYMLFADEQGQVQLNPVIVKAVDRIFILHADHEQNASTSTVRLVASTGSDPFVCVAAGIAALWGPAHGGANEAALSMLKEIGSVDHIEHYIKRAKDHDDPFRLMGFGHRVYKNYDPRAKMMRQACHEVLLAVNGKDNPLFQLAMKLEQIALEDEYFISKKLYPNVDFYSGITLSAMGIPISMFTPIFALARTSGWMAHWDELMSDPNFKIGRPRQLYVGKTLRKYEAARES